MNVRALLFLGLATAFAHAEDTCESLVPMMLEAQLKSAYPNYRLPHEADNLAEDVQYAHEQGGTGCLGVASGDFDGDGRSDYIIGLTQSSGPGAKIVVALAGNRRWKLLTLDTWKDDRPRLYVSADPPGTFDRFGGLDGPIDKDEVEHLKCPHAAAVFGATESSGVAYCYVKSQWQHVWFSD